MRGISVNRKLVFSISYSGSNGHSCYMSGVAVGTENGWAYDDDESECVLSFEVKPQGISVLQNEQCNDYCGMRAWNGFEVNFEY